MADTKRSDAIGVAVQMEKEGIEFYRKAAGQSRNPLGRRMFESLAADERRHVEIFQALAAREGVRPAAAEELDREGPLKRMSAIFRDAAANIKEVLTADSDDIKAIDVAKGMEEKAFAFYAEAARGCASPVEKRILLKIAAEENEHYRILDDTRLYLTYPEMWFIKEEKPVIDGG